MAYEQKPNSGSLFKNHKKEKDTHPDYTGQALIGGVAYWVSAWIKKGPKGTYMSFAYKPKEQQPPREEPPREEPKKPAQPSTPSIEDGDVPF